MSVRVLSNVLRHSEAALASRLVLIVLADGAHDDGVTWDGQNEIAAKANVANSTVRSALETLAYSGEIEVRKAQVGRRRINVYRVACADIDPDYERLPFKLKEPFTTTAEIWRSSEGPDEGDDRRSTSLTTAESLRVYKERTRKRTRTGASAPDEGTPDATTDAVPVSAPPPLTSIDGRNVALDALANVCGIDEKSPRMVEAAALLAGKKATARKPATPGIRDVCWLELERKHPEVLDELRENPEMFERGLARRIGQKVELYRQLMPPGSFLSPGALLKYWLDLDLIPARPAGGMTMTPEEIVRMGEEAGSGG